MVRLFLAGSMLLALTAATAAPEPAKVLLVEGGRPWEAAEIRDLIRRMGYACDCIDSTGLAGLGGAPLGPPGDPTAAAPAPKDDLGPALERLAEYRAVAIAGLTLENAAKLFTPERAARLAAYVQEGGGLFLTATAPAALGEVAPVTLGALRAPRPMRASTLERTHPAVAGLPEEWPVVNAALRQAQPKPGAAVLAAEAEAQGSPILVAGTHGAGRVLFLNGDIAFGSAWRVVRKWAYFPQLLGGALGWLSGQQPDLDAVRRYVPPYPEEPVVPSAEVRLDPPRFEERTPAGAPGIEETADRLRVTFSNGCRLELSKVEGCFSLATPEGREWARCDLPRVMASGTDPGEWTATDESIAAQPLGQAKPLYPVCRYVSCRAEEAGIAVTLRGETAGGGVELTWRVAPRTVQVGETTWQGVGDSLRVGATTDYVERLDRRLEWTAGGACEAWRLACYGRPRGFAAIRFEGEAAQTTGRWAFFADGQAFTLFGGEGLTALQLADEPALVHAEVARAQGETVPATTLQMELGRRRGPLETPFVWHLTTSGAPDPVRWTGVTQWLRERYRAQAGLQRQVPLPTAHIGEPVAPFPKHGDYARKAAEKLAAAGFRRLYLGDVGHVWIDDFREDTREELRRTCARARELGLEVSLWVPTTHVWGRAPILKEHPEWAVRRRDGEHAEVAGFPGSRFLSLSGGFLPWALPRLAALKEIGFGAVWLDTYAPAAGHTPFGEKDPDPPVPHLTRYFREIEKLGLGFWVEGQSPLPREGFWYRSHLYPPHRGREWAFVGSSLYTGPAPTNDLDPFRLAMVDCFPILDMVGFVEGVELYEGQAAIDREAIRVNAIANKVMARIGEAPFVRPEAFGASWRTAKGAALWFSAPAAAVRVTMPAGWKLASMDLPPGEETPSVVESKGAWVLRDVPARSVILFATEKEG